MVPFVISSCRIIGVKHSKTVGTTIVLSISDLADPDSLPLFLIDFTQATADTPEEFTVEIPTYGLYGGWGLVMYRNRIYDKHIHSDTQLVIRPNVILNLSAKRISALVMERLLR